MELDCKAREIYRKSEIVAKTQFLYASRIYSCITRFFKTNPEKCYRLAEYNAMYGDPTAWTAISNGIM